MDQYAAKIQSRISKIESSLWNLTNEILVTAKYLSQLRENSTQMVENLNSITVPEIYLKEFMNVNCIILKYLNFLTEVNCKFEMLEMSENNLKYLNSVKKSKSETKLKNINKEKLSVCCESIENLNLTEEFGTLKDEVPLESQNTLHSSCDEKYDNVDSNEENTDLINPKSNSESSLDLNQSDTLKEETIFDDNIDLSYMSCSSFKSDCIAETLSDSCSLPGLSPLNTVEKPALLMTKDNLDSKDASTESVNLKVGNMNITQASGKESASKTQLTEIKKNKTENKVIKPINIIRKPGEEYDVVIENIKSPSEFYVSLKNNKLNQLDELEKKLKLLPKVENKFSAKRQKNMKSQLTKELGNYVLFYSKCDEMWYRAEIINWFFNYKDDFVSIFLIDYGETKCVAIDDLQAMPEDMKDYPAFALQCHLYGVFPLEMDQDSESIIWEKASIEKMRSLTETSDKVRIKIAASDDCFDSDLSLPVTLWLVDQGNKCVNQLLVESKCAVMQTALSKDLVDAEKDEEDEEDEDEELVNWNPMKEDFESYKNCYDLDINDPAAIIYGYVGNDYNRICPHFAKNGACFKRGACRKEHRKLDPLGFTTDQEEIYNRAFNVLPVPPPKSVINVQITCLLTFNQFCCIPIKNFHSDEENLQSLLKFMNKPENVREMKRLLIPPSTGQIVIARYSKDCTWYRARILESQPEKDLYTVLFVDYGNKEILPLSSLRAVEARYLHLPFQNMQCSIYGVDRNPKIPSKIIMDYINNRIYNSHVTIEIVSRLPGGGTNLLVHVFDENGRNIGKDMIAQKYGIKKTEIIVNSDSESIPG